MKAPTFSDVIDPDYRKNMLDKLGYDPVSECRINKIKLMSDRIKEGYCCDVTDGYRKGLKQDDIKFFYRLLEDVKPIMFKLSKDMMDTVVNAEEIIECDLPVDLPFQTFSIEPANDWHSLYTENSDEGLLNANIIVIHEKTPEHLILYTLYNFIPKKDSIKPVSFVEKSHLIFHGTGKPTGKTVLYAPISLYLSKLDNRTAKVKYHTRMKAKINGEKRLIKLKTNAIFIDIEKRYKQTRFGSQHIEWTHSWEVRGHWRRFTGTGKNRDGLRCIENWTWVRPHIKGDGELVSKSRVVK